MVVEVIFSRKPILKIEIRCSWVLGWDSGIPVANALKLELPSQRLILPPAANYVTLCGNEVQKTKREFLGGAGSACGTTWSYVQKARVI